MRKPLSLLCLFSLLLFSCQDNGKERLLNEKILNQDDDTKELIKTFYNIPSPSEQLMNLRELDGKDVTTLLLSPNDAYKFNTSKDRLIAFGMYAADAAYLASKNKSAPLVNYLAILKILSQDLGLKDLVSEDLTKILSQQDKPADSLFVMADQFYLNAFDRMLESGKGAELGMILFGGWVETVHLAIQSSNGFSASPKIDRFLADQKLVAENLLSYLLDYQDSDDAAAITEEVGQLLAIFDNMNCQFKETEVVKTQEKITLSGGEKCSMTEKVFADLKNGISTKRNEYAK
jgi:hypothetical protein